jgi:PAS domain S-box-containing protein
MKDSIQNLRQENLILKKELAELKNKHSQEKESNRINILDLEARWKFAMEEAGVGLWDWNPVTNKVFFSKQWKEMLGYQEEEIGDSLEEWEKRIHPDDKAQFLEDITKHFKGETNSYRNEHRVLCKDGTYKWILDRGKVIERDKDGNPLRVIGTHTDISEHKKLQESLKESEMHFKSIFENHDAVMLLIDPFSGKIIGANHAAYLFYGYSTKELCEMYISQINMLPPEKIAEKRQRALDEKRNYFIFPHKLKNGQERIVEVYSSPIPFEPQPILFSIIHDITNRIEKEREVLFLSHERKKILDNIINSVFLVNDRKVIWANKRATEMFGYSLEEMVGQTTLQFYFKEQDFISMGNEAYPILMNGDIYKSEHLMKKKNGEQMWCAISGLPMNFIQSSRR